ncbi:MULTISPECIES: hypothetical protein [unclassified Bartonella]|uniref:hypothetical protein n=1 Tax=unclassified Bartonella TaxID=2645622 RepID=UPI0035D01C0A
MDSLCTVMEVGVDFSQWFIGAIKNAARVYWLERSINNGFYFCETFAISRIFGKDDLVSIALWD